MEQRRVPGGGNEPFCHWLQVGVTAKPGRFLEFLEYPKRGHGVERDRIVASDLFAADDLLVLPQEGAADDQLMQPDRDRLQLRKRWYVHRRRSILSGGLWTSMARFGQSCICEHQGRSVSGTSHRSESVGIEAMNVDAGSDWVSVSGS